MSKRINVNPGHYKTAGRERQGDDVVHELERQRLSVAAEESRHAPPPKPTRDREDEEEEAADQPPGARRRGVGVERP